MVITIEYKTLNCLGTAVNSEANGFAKTKATVKVITSR